MHAIESNGPRWCHRLCQLRK